MWGIANLLNIDRSNAHPNQQRADPGKSYLPKNNPKRIVPKIQLNFQFTASTTNDSIENWVVSLNFMGMKEFFDTFYHLIYTKPAMVASEPTIPERMTIL